MYGNENPEGAPVAPETRLFSDEATPDEPRTDSEGAPAAPDTTETPEADESRVEIDGKTYTEDQLKEFMSGVPKRVYTQKTQQFAEDLRQRDAEIEDLRSKLEELTSMSPREDNPQVEDYEDPAVRDIVARLNRQEGSLAKALAMLEKQEEVRSQEFARLNTEQQWDKALDGLEGRPFLDRNEVRSFADQNGLGPEQASLAYSALYGAAIGKAAGERAAMSRGATAPPVMGAGNSRISPGFTSPHDAPGVRQSLQDMSWNQLRDAAANDPNIPGR